MAASFTNVARACVLSCVIAAAGCGGAADTPAPADTDSNMTAAPAPASSGDVAASPADTAAIRESRQTVTSFLQSLKSGDQTAATSLLTTKAQAEMARTEASIQPPGSPSATFDVTTVELRGANQEGAHVLSVWRDTDEDGTPTEHEIIWLLMKEKEAWAIAGFATRVFDDKPPLILNFEDPLDLQRKRSAVDTEIARRMETSEEPAGMQAQRGTPARR